MNLVSKKFLENEFEEKYGYLVEMNQMFVTYGRIEDNEKLNKEEVELFINEANRFLNENEFLFLNQLRDEKNQSFKFEIIISGNHVANGKNKINLINCSIVEKKSVLQSLISRSQKKNIESLFHK